MIIYYMIIYICIICIKLIYDGFYIYIEIKIYIFLEMVKFVICIYWNVGVGGVYVCIWLVKFVIC